MKKIRLAVITAGLIAVMSGMTATAQSGRVTNCGDFMCGDTLSKLNIKTCTVQSIDTAKCGNDWCSSQQINDTIRNILNDYCLNNAKCTTPCDGMDECSSECDESLNCLTECEAEDNCTTDCETENTCTSDCDNENVCTTECDTEEECLSDCDTEENCTTDCKEADETCTSECESEKEDTCTDCIETSNSDSDTYSFTLKTGTWEDIESFLKQFINQEDIDNDTQDSETEISEDDVVQDGYEISEYEQKVCDLVNDIRTQYGLAPLSVNAELSKIARIKSEDMKEVGYFSHTSPTYGSPFDMMKQFGISYRTAGENIAMGQRTPEEVVNGWMNSEGHRANILNNTFTQIGVGYVENGHYWTQMFVG